MLKIGVLVSGGGTNLQAIIDAIKCGYIKNAEISIVISSTKKAYAIQRAIDNNIEYAVVNKKTYPIQEDFDKAIVDKLKEKDCDLVLLAGFMSIFGDELVREFDGRIMNIHPSLIPAFCGKGFYGLKTHEAVLFRGVKITGATVHFVNEITDGGPIVLQKTVDISDDDTPESLQKKVMEQAEWIIYPEAVKLFADGKLKIENGKCRIIT